MSQLDRILQDVSTKIAQGVMTGEWDEKEDTKERVKALFIDLVNLEVYPCEPECTKERHAYHQGQWEMGKRIEEKINNL